MQRPVSQLTKQRTVQGYEGKAVDDADAAALRNVDEQRSVEFDVELVVLKEHAIAVAVCVPLRDRAGAHVVAGHDVAVKRVARHVGLKRQRRWHRPVVALQKARACHDPRADRAAQQSVAKGGVVDLAIVSTGDEGCVLVLRVVEILFVDVLATLIDLLVVVFPTGTLGLVEGALVAHALGCNRGQAVQRRARRQIGDVVGEATAPPVRAARFKAPGLEVRLKRRPRRHRRHVGVATVLYRDQIARVVAEVGGGKGRQHHPLHHRIAEDRVSTVALQGRELLTQQIDALRARHRARARDRGVGDADIAGDHHHLAGFVRAADRAVVRVLAALLEGRHAAHRVAGGVALHRSFRVIAAARRDRIGGAVALRLGDVCADGGVVDPVGGVGGRRRRVAGRPLPNRRCLLVGRELALRQRRCCCEQAADDDDSREWCGW